MSPLFDALVVELQRRFPDRGLIVEPGQTSRARFPAMHPEVGDLVVEDDTDQITVFFGNFTHSHYHTVDSVVEELAALFSDRLKMWGGAKGGGIARLDYDGLRIFGRFKLFRPKGPQFVWSGPFK